MSDSNSTLDEIGKVAEIAGESIPVILVLVGAIAKILSAKGNSAAQLDALQTAAEAVKAQMDKLKFPNESAQS